MYEHTRALLATETLHRTQPSHTVSVPRLQCRRIIEVALLLLTLSMFATFAWLHVHYVGYVPQLRVRGSLLPAAVAWTLCWCAVEPVSRLGCRLRRVAATSCGGHDGTKFDV